MRLRLFSSKRGLVLSVLISSFMLQTFESSAAILLEEGGKPVRRSKVSKFAVDGKSLRKIRRVGIGASAAGPLGVAGLNLELNLNPETSFVGGFGGGQGFQAYTMQIKKVLGGDSWLPYAMAGYSRWYSVGQPAPVSESTSPAFLADRFLDEQQRATGTYGVNLIYPGVGLQFVQSSGPWAGSSVFFEALMLLDLEDFVAAPTATVGYLYYF